MHKKKITSDAHLEQLHQIVELAMDVSTNLSVCEQLQDVIIERYRKRFQQHDHIQYLKFANVFAFWRNTVSLQKLRSWL